MSDGPTLPPLPTADRPGKVLAGLGCASCGGAVEVQEGWTNVRCRYCDTALAVVGERGVTRVMVMAKLDRSWASREVRKWFMKGIKKEPALKHEARFDEAFLAWFPFVRTRFDLVGWVLGVKRTKKKRGDKWVTVDTPVEREIEQTVDRTAPAADMAEFGVHRVDLAGDEILPLDEAALRAKGMVFRPRRAPAEAAEELTELAMSAARQGHDLHRVTFSWFASLRREITLVYYPLWVFRYRFRDRTYQVLVDAEDGTLAYGKAPGNHLYRAFALVAASAGAAFVGTTTLQHLGFLLRSDNGFAALGVLGLVLAGLVIWGYAQFRHGGVVEEGTGLAEDRQAEELSASIKKMLDQFE